MLGKKIYTSAAILFFGTMVLSQDTTAIATENIQVIRNYEAIIQQAKKKEIKVEKSAKNLKSLNYSYDLKSKVDLDFERATPIIRPLTYSEESKQNKDIKDGRIYGAYGTYSTLAAGGAYHYYIEDWVEAGFKVDHQSAKDKNLPFQKYANTEGDLYLGYFLSPKTKVTAEFRGGNDQHFSQELLSFEQDTFTKQNFNRMGASFGFTHNSFENSGLSIRSRFSYDRIKQTIDTTSENQLKVELNILKKISDKITFEIPFVYNKNNYTTNIDSSFSDIVVSPFLKFHGENFNLKAGVELVRNSEHSFYFPVIRFDMDEIFEEVHLSLFTESRYQRSNLFNLSRLVPYYQTMSTLFLPDYLRSYNLQLSRKIGFASASLKISYNDYFGDVMVFDNSPVQRALVDTVSREEIRITPSINYTSEQVSLTLGSEYNLFMTVKKDDLNYRPQFSAFLKASETLFDKKLKFSQSIRFVGSRNFNPPVGSSSLDSYFDLTCGLDFKASKTIGIFVHGTNLLGSEYELWYRHPVFERQIWGGVKIDL